ncbi:MAG: hypothetical protein KDF60_18195 [Calditrichaeota bacterium]|nr:hypothetical protein [Calditrichota bacterium]MCB0284521.1 hypothetical protein [Calditrichota bacterium]
MKKLASLIITLAFTVSIALAVINTANSGHNVSSKKTYAAICPVPIPPPPPEKTKSGN